MFTFVLCYVILASLKTCNFVRDISHMLFSFFGALGLPCCVGYFFFLVAVSGGYSSCGARASLFAVVLRENLCILIEG